MNLECEHGHSPSGHRSQFWQRRNVQFFHLDENWQATLAILEKYEPLQPFLFNELSKLIGAKTFVDIGANIGLTVSQWRLSTA